MGFYPRILIPALALVMLFPLQAWAGKSGCLDCHVSHYAEQGKCTDCHRGNDRTDRKRVAHDGIIPGRFAWFTIKGSQPTVRGKELLDRFACRRCHTVGGKGNRLATNLDGILLRRRPPEIAAAIEAPVQYMPDFRLAPGEVTDLVNAIIAESPPVMAKTGETPLVIHFEEDKQLAENEFVKRCGQCHKALSERYGGLGRGDIAPNLSGLFTRFYPETFREHERWSIENLRKWLQNPRRLRKNARMIPIPIKSDEFGRLADILRATP